MAETSTEGIVAKPLRRLAQVLRLEKKEIGAIYFYAILAGLLQLTVPLGVQAVINFVLAGALSTSMVVLILMVVIAVFLTGLLQVNQMKITEKIQQRIFARYSFEFAWRIPKLDMQKVDSYYLPEVVNRFFDTISLQKSFSKLLLDIPAATIQIIFGLVLLSLYANIFIVFSILVVFLLYLILKLTVARGLKTSLQESEYKYEVASWLEEVARVLKSFRFSKGSSLPVDKTDKIVSNYLDARTSHFKILMLQYWSLIAFKVLITAGMFIVGSVLLVKNQINIGQFVAAEIVILTVLSSIEKFIQSLDKVYDLLTSLEKLGKVIDKPLEKEGTLKIADDAGKGLKVAMQDMNFGYTSDRNIVHNAGFELNGSDKACIMGDNGSGKSTLIKLLTGSYHNFEGSITIDGVPIGNYDPDSVRAHTGILFNQQDIFQGTLYENIALGNTAITTAEIISLAEKIGLKDFIISLKAGFDTLIEPTGKRLPGGIIRKILLLRALVGGPRLLLLEEPWQGFDESSQQLIKQYLINETVNTTCIIITNDEQFARQCSYVMLMKDGTIIKKGVPSSVL
ncbi:MAG: ATP-binding cassette domain-containing protein [Chitinophagaceae bacterium]|nr:ATP-binding cassette domain-containing protein [Chitinophagaceae bacterium]